MAKTQPTLDRYEVIVIGGGPAGLMAAGKAAEQGTKTLLIEKDKDFGTKACGEAISQATLDDAEIVPFPQSISAENVDRVLVYAPNERKKVEISAAATHYPSGYIVDKPALLRQIAQGVATKGAEIWMNSTAQKIARSDNLSTITVTRDGKTLNLQAEIVIGCDGVNSLVAKTFFNRSGYELISCLQYKMANCDLPSESTLEIFVGNEVAPQGYAWIFPKGKGMANVGIGVRGAAAKVYLDKFIRRHPQRFKEAQLVGIGAAPVPISGQVRDIVSDGLMLCGDAAGQVISLTGGGIHSSIVAGKIAGRVAAEAIFKGNTSKKQLLAYPNEFNKVWGDRIKGSLKAQQAIVNLSDDELNQLAGMLSGEDIIDLANGLNLIRVGMKLLKYPVFAVKIAKTLL